MARTVQAKKFGGIPQTITSHGKTKMVRIGIVGIGFMGMIHY